ncbi:MAG: hypothetical protein CMK59_11875 [Proteobacteria bacterium]|nr:hypothetical protein [Pseudomonadota bacterium]
MLLPFISSLASAETFDTDLIYFILVDRFADGIAVDEQQSFLDPSDIAAFHGGDLYGIINRADHLEKMGVDAIWLSPIFEMRHEKFMGHGAIHGYWLHSMDRIEPFFGGEEALQKLSSDLEQREWKLILDMVYNHVSFDSPFLEIHPDWFHESKPIEDWNDPYQLTHHTVHGLPDLDQSREVVYRYLYHRSIHWQNQTKAAGFRIDAIRHMENDFLKRLSTDLHQELGNSFWLLGEDFNGSPSALASRVNETGIDSLFDFPLYYAMTDTFCRDQSMFGLAATLWSDRDYPKEHQPVRFLDNHDLPRIASLCEENRLQEALFFLFTVRGIPMLTYGTEFGLSGAEEPENRESIDWKESPKWLPLISDLSALRSKHPVLKQGAPQIVHVDDQVLLYAQRHGSKFALVGINHSQKTYSVPFSNPDASYRIRDQRLQKNAPLNLEPEDISVWIWNEAPISAPKLKNYTIKVHSKSEHPLFLIGSSSVIGGWNPQHALPFNQTNEGWELELELPSDATLLWKTLQKNGTELIWEQGDNHILWSDPILAIELSK